jgi:pyruvate kinase
MKLLRDSEWADEAFTPWAAPGIMATIGPTLEKPDDLCQAILEGATWFRFPCGYRQRPHLENARALRAAAARTGVTVQWVLDLPSSRPRTGRMDELRLTPGDKVLFWDPDTTPSPVAHNGALPVPLPGLEELLAKLSPSEGMWFCDGRLRFVIQELRERSVLAKLVEGNVPLKSSNSLFLPHSPSPFSVLTAPDRELLRSFAADGMVPQWLALSLIASAEDVRFVRHEVPEIVGQGVRMMAKVETTQAVENMDAIIQEADGIMVARGDLGLAIGFTRLPEVQEELVTAARQAGKVSVVATQILEAFAETGIPQRAELSDLSLIARQRAGVIMLGKETVFSPRPLACIRMARELLANETRRFERAARAQSQGRLGEVGKNAIGPPGQWK